MMEGMPKALLEEMGEETFQLDSGLTVCVKEMPGYESVYAVYGTRFGSADRSFVLNGERIDLPAGVAHFLEHKMFENEEGVDAFELYAKTGAMANAYTSFDKTCYVFGASEQVDESLDILLSFVSKPYFTAETVHKEQGIIGQEIKMYDDNPEWRMMFAMFDCLYHTCPVRDDIAGSVDSIAQITPEMLYKCTEAFYRPSNMVLAVAGGITAKQVLAACERAGLEKKTARVERLLAGEPEEIRRGEQTLFMSVSQPIVGLGYKETPFAAKEERLKGEFICDILTELIIGDTAPLYRELYDKGLLNPGFSGEFLAGQGYLNFIFAGETREPQAVVAAIKKEIARLRREGVDEGRFLAIKNVLLGEAVTDLESTEAVATDMASAYMLGRTRREELETLAALTKKDVEVGLAVMLCEERSAVVTILPAKEKE